MKLNEYIHKKLEKSKLTTDKSIVNCPTEERIEKWIVEWYNDTFKELDDKNKPRGPPMWLAEWRKFV
jgi:hypothetical protein